MAYDGTIPAGGPGNFVSPNTATEVEGVEVDFITVDFINSMAAEVTHPLASANTAGLELAKNAIQNEGVNILGNGVLTSAHEMTYMVRRASLDTISATTTAAAIQAAIRALDGMTPDKVTATISSATVTATDIGILTAAAV